MSKESKVTPETELEAWHRSEVYTTSRKWVIDELSGIERKGINEIIEFLEGSDYFDAPASSKYHLNVCGGLLVHSIRVAKEFINQMDKQFGFEQLDYDGALICGLLHDLCKVNLYKRKTAYGGISKAQESYELEPEENWGHGDKSLQLITEIAGKGFLSPEEKGIIRWHMYNFDKTFWDYQTYINKHPMIRIFYACDLIATSLDEIKGMNL